MPKELETMSAFFEKRVDTYDEHMLANVLGCKEGYELMAQLIPKKAHTLLDLGCGTGLELDHIYKKFPDIKVTGIDLCEAMLSKLRDKHKSKSPTLILGDYFEQDLGTDRFDCAVSFESLHHFDHISKTALYKKIYTALKKGGVYIECDYMASSLQEEQALFEECAQLRKSQNIKADQYVHFDTPCCTESQIAMLTDAGFVNIEQMMKIGGTVMLAAHKD